MKNSNLVNYIALSPNNSGERTHEIDTITIHCMAAQSTAKQCADYFTNANVQASANYCVGYDGSVALSVPENMRSWASSDRENDQRAITIEVASDNFAPYAVKIAAYDALINLLVDICKRNGIKKLVWSDDKYDRVNHLRGCNMTVHRDFANKACPGDWLYSRMAQIAETVNLKMEDKPMNEMEQAQAWAIENGIIQGYGDGNYGWDDPLTRKQFVTILFRLFKKGIIKGE